VSQWPLAAHSTTNDLLMSGGRAAAGRPQCHQTLRQARLPAVGPHAAVRAVEVAQEEKD
jgi:hypothetical protein